MNWSRGLFRVWLVATVIWVGFIGVQATKNWPSEPTGQMTFTGRIFKFETWGQHPEFGTAPVTREQRVGHAWDVAGYLAIGIGLAVIPPAAVLIIAGVLMWVGRGFQSGAA